MLTQYKYKSYINKVYTGKYKQDPRKLLNF